MLNLSDKIVTIIGAQRSGLAIAKLVLRLGGRPQITEFAAKEILPKDNIQWIEENHIPFECNGHTQAFLEGSSLVILSPGVSLNTMAVQWAREKNIPVLGEIEFANQFCDKPIIAVSGSNGKTTVVTLIDLVIKAAGKKSRLCGNVGLPFSNYALDLKGIDYVVLEVSSFQMESLLDHAQASRVPEFKPFKPLIGVILNFSENHLDRHKDLDEYFSAKTRMFINQTKNEFAVLNGHDERLLGLKNQLSSQVIYFDSQSGENPNQRAVVHVAKILGIGEDVCADVFKNFKGVEHRLEWVRELDGVEYINDSKATTAEAGRWALTRVQKPVVMICGGRDKHIDFSVLSDLVKKKVKKMIVFGEAKEKLKKTFEGVVEIEVADKLETAVQKARRSAHKGECVLLSPMCASFDMFANYEERGKIFKSIVNGLN